MGESFLGCVGRSAKRSKHIKHQEESFKHSSAPDKGRSHEIKNWLVTKCNLESPAHRDARTNVLLEVEGEGPTTVDLVCKSLSTKLHKKRIPIFSTETRRGYQKLEFVLDIEKKNSHSRVRGRAVASRPASCPGTHSRVPETQSLPETKGNFERSDSRPCPLGTSSPETRGFQMLFAGETGGSRFGSNCWRPERAIGK